MVDVYLQGDEYVRICDFGMTLMRLSYTFDITTSTRQQILDVRLLFRFFTKTEIDMVDVYLQDSPLGDEYVRICDFGMTLMRLSYTFDITTSTRQQILDSILINNNVRNNDGDLYLDAPVRLLYESILQFVGCTQKVCNMRYWSREVVRSAFYDDLEDYVTVELKQFAPVADQAPLPHYPISVDWSLTYNSRSFYVFGVRGNDNQECGNCSFGIPEGERAVHQSCRSRGHGRPGCKGSPLSH